MGILLFLNRVKDKFAAATGKTVVEPLALSIIIYCLPVYGTTNNTLIKRVQNLQNFASKMCWRSERRDHATPFITQMNWLIIERKVATVYTQNGFYSYRLSERWRMADTIQDNTKPYMYRTSTPTAGHVHSSSLAPECGTHCHNTSPTQTHYVFRKKN